MNDELRELYQEVILEHNRSSKHFHEIEDADLTQEGFNPLCGDRYTLYVKMTGDTIEEVGFTGSGCAISKASASILCDRIPGMSREEADALFDDFTELVTGEADPTEKLDRFGDLAALGGVRHFPMRVKCATLPWHTLRAALTGQGDVVTTE